METKYGNELAVLAILALLAINANIWWHRNR